MSRFFAENRRSTSLRSPIVLTVLIAWGIGVVLSVLAAGDGVLAGDTGVARWVQRADGSGATTIADLGNWVGAYRTGAIITVIVLVGLAAERRWAGIVLLLAVMLTRALNSTVKGWIDSPRPTPDFVRITEDADGLGFPSGHASGAMLLFGALAWIAGSWIPAGLWRTIAVGGCVVTILTVGWARIFTGAHWPTDVLGGYVIGYAILGTIVIALTRVERTERMT